MLNNPALDIALGLVFIYAIYSLLTTTLTELIASFINQRGKTLKNGISRMLDGDEKTSSGNLTSSDDPESTDDNPTKKLPSRLSEAFFDIPEIKYLGRKAWGIYRLPSFIKSKTFAKSLLKTLGYVNSEQTDLVSLKNRLDPDNEIHQLIINLIDEADNNIEKFKILAEDWFNDIMDRVSGWYKRRIQLITFIAGGLIAFSLNVNTVDIAEKLGRDEKARLAMVQAATNYMEAYSQVPALSTDTLQIQELSDNVKDLVNESATISSIVNLNYPKLNTSSRADWGRYILGCLLTTIALSIGSPFWFDLLNKLIKLRSAGTQNNSSNTSNNTNAVG
jgi:hypothetical protein